jgi:hypothetical protein
MNELQRRVVAGAALEMLGHGGKTAVATASGMSRNTVIKAEAEVTAGIEPSDRLRAVGGGDKPLIDKQPGLLAALDELVHPETRGNPMSLLRWTSKSSTKLAGELVSRGYDVSSRTVLRLLHQLGYSLQGNAKVTEGRQHADRDAQFRYPNDIAATFIADDKPAISVDTKKKALIGDYANGGNEWSLRVNRNGSRSTTSPTVRWASSRRRSRTGSTTSPTIKAGSQSVMSLTPPSSRSKQSDGGGTRWADNVSRTRHVY